MKTLVSFFCHSRMYLSGIFTVLFASALNAQSTDIKLTTEADSISNFRVLNSLGVTRMQVNSDGGLYVGGVYPTGVIPIEGTGTRMMWYPGNAALRAGYVDDTQWDDANIGDFSTAFGYSSIASGPFSLAAGRIDTASGYSSIAMGDHSTASNEASVAIGHYAKSIEMFSTAIGPNTVATGFASSAFGSTTTASGGCSTAMGNYVSTNNKNGAFIIGDYSTGTTVTNSDSMNRMTMRFAGGYKLFTNSGCTLGAYLDHNATAWTVLCDRNRKENFRQIDGEQILAKIRTIPITEWNYKETDPTVKYIGPAAQDFYSAFHLGGTDSLGINSLCIDGVNIAAIQALEKRTAELQKANEQISLMVQQNNEQKIINSKLIERIEKLEQMITSSTTNNNSLAPSVQFSNNK